MDGAYALPGVTFGEAVGPIDLPAGAKEINVYLADGVACGDPLAITARIDISRSPKRRSSSPI